MKTFMAAVEIAAIVAELQMLVDGKIDKIYQPDKKDFFFQIHVPSQGKQLLKVRLGKYLFLTGTKPQQKEPTDFCARLRKRLMGARIRSLSQYEGQRVVVVELEKKEEKLRVIFELFSKGNLLVLNSEGMIMLAQERTGYAGRELKAKVQYHFPKADVTWSHVTERSLKDKLKSTEIETLVKSLAIDLGLGGLYAEEICNRVELERNLSPLKINQHKAKKLFEGIKDLRKELAKPKGYLYGSEIVPIKLSDKPSKEFDSFSLAVDESLGISEADEVRKRHEDKFAARLKKVHNIVSAQEKAVRKLEKKAKDDQRRGELIFEQYGVLTKIVSKIKDLAKKEGWEETGKKLKKGKVVKEINLKEKKIVLEIDS